MSELLVPSRRGFLRVLGATLAAPAIIRLAPIMPVRPIPSSRLLTINQLTLEAIRLWKNDNKFLQEVEAKEWYSAPDYSIGTSLRIRLPRDYRI